MYQVGDLVIYANSGVCRVSAVGALAMDQERKNRAYYTLSPLYGTETIYAPVDTRVYLRPILTRTEAEGLIQNIPTIREDRVDEKNLQMLTRYYQDSLESHELNALLQLLKTIDIRSSAAVKNGKKPGKIEEKYKKRAEELLYGELAVALGITRDDVPGYIRHALGS